MVSGGSSAQDLLASLASRKSLGLRNAIDATAAFLRRGAITDDEVAEIGSRLVALADHSTWEVRKAVAHAILYLRHPTFHAALAKLLEDDNAWVRDAATHTQTRRAVLTRTDALKEQRGDLLHQWLSEHEARYGLSARLQAMRVAERYVDLHARETRHEVVRAVTAADLAIGNVMGGLAKAGVPDAIWRSSMARAKDRVLHVGRVVESVCEYAKQVALEFRDEPLREMLGEAVAQASGNLQPSGRPVTVEMSVDPALHLDASRHRLLQAFSNIVQNALEAYPDEPSAALVIKIEAHTDDPRQVVVRFVDHGCGMSEEVLRHSVQLYSTNNKPGGTGFGLPLAKKIIETEHRGTLELRSKEGAGTTVIVVLPAEHEKREEYR